MIGFYLKYIFRIHLILLKKELFFLIFFNDNQCFESIDYYRNKKISVIEIIMF